MKSLNNTLYTIRGLKCAYNGGETVLSVPALAIEAGQIMVVLGKSGYGKSTFLETLALMNNTIKEGSVEIIPPSLNGVKKYELASIWQTNDIQLQAGIRSAHFSFIFQQTNLMPNFSVYENIYITRMIQGCPIEQCQKETAEILDRIGLSHIDAKRNVTELSGGQRQRVAFARAIISSFDVLFGDEPTGNLDEVNTSELLSILAGFIHNSNSESPKTAIIVTHSIDMALKFGDSIVVIKKDEGPAVIESVFRYRKQLQNGQTTWENEKTTLKEEEFKIYLRKQFFSY